MRVFYIAFAFTVLYFNAVRRGIIERRDAMSESINNDIKNTFNVQKYLILIIKIKKLKHKVR
jgi:hypothetical protein